MPITIGVFSASAPISATVPSRYARGKKYLEAKGFRVIDGNLCGKSDAYRSGSIRDRADEFNALLHNPQVDIIMSAIGGNNTNSILPYIDYAAFAAHPKPVVGYSDTTALLLALYAQTGVTTYYGPALAASFGEFPPLVDETYESFRRILLDPPASPYTYPMPPRWTDEFIDWATQSRAKTTGQNDWLCIRPGAAQGRLIGGNLNTMEGIFGTPYMPEIREGDILLLEDSAKNASVIERSFSLLKLAGVFNKIGGVILGKHEQYNDLGTGRRPHEILLEVLGDAHFPILADFDCCHTHPMLTMPIGRTVRLDASAKTVTLL